jgi:hypothetical protein
LARRTHARVVEQDLSTSECALRTALSFLQNPVLPDERACDGEASPA